VREDELERLLNELQANGVVAHAIVVSTRGNGVPMMIAMSVTHATGGHYEAITAPTALPDKMKALAAQLTATPAPIALKRADVPVALAKLVMQCLEKEREKRPHGLRPAATRPTSERRELGGEREALRLERPPVARRSRETRSLGSADHADPPLSAPDQVPRGLERPVLVVGEHHVDPGIVHAFSKGDDGHPLLEDVPQVGGSDLEGDDHHPVHVPVGNVGGELELPLPDGIGVADEGPVSPGHRVVEPPGEHRIEGVRDVGDDERDRVGAFVAQAPCETVRAET